jgi:hypothetical protein
MKRKFLTLISSVLLLVTLLCLSSCLKSEYDELDDMGYTVSVRFDANGGTFKGSNSTVVDSFNPDESTVIKLLSPDDDRRGKNNKMEVSKPECMLAGWYASRTPIDENDLSKGYTYSDRWDFEKDSITLDENKEYTANEPVLTLYAAWIPYFTFEYYTEDGVKYAETSGYSITVPEWKTGDATIDMGKFPKRDGYTLLSAYSDSAMQNAVSGRVEGKWDIETASVESPVIRIYTEWAEGNQYRIYSADQLRKNADVNGIYTLMADIDFSRVDWDNTFKNGIFNGAFYGNGYKISNISYTANNAKGKNGLFSSIGSSARFENITFENVVCSINPSVKVNNGARYGLISSAIAEGAEFVSVSVSGSIIFGEGASVLASTNDYQIFLLSGCGTKPQGISYDITVDVTDEVKDEATPPFTVSKDGDEVILEFN